MAEKQKDLGYKILIVGFQGVIRILLYILVAVILFVIGKQAYTIGYQVVDTAPMVKENGVDVTVTITDDMSVMEIGELLRDWGLIDEYPVSFMLQEMMSGNHNKILPGTYVLNTGMSIEEILTTLSQVEETDDEEDKS